MYNLYKQYIDRYRLSFARLAYVFGLAVYTSFRIDGTGIPRESHQMGVTKNNTKLGWGLCHL